MRKSYKIQLDKEHTLRFGTNEIAALEETLGRPLTSLVQERDGKRSFYFGVLELRAMLWAGLQKEARDMDRLPYSLEEVGDMLDDAPDYVEACRVIGVAVGENLGGPAKN